ncbi:helix-turn-helix transcriptional regulator [Nonomuraea sp. NPDC005983]|uniref:helix-turn-helix transcriptional regulator n=1 Tax=Nonomuraea sp. NPDC005983 TaxID=3155595 RepID=UPI0033A3EF3A
MLDRLAAEGLVELDREEGQQGRLRRYYRLTDSGARPPRGRHPARRHRQRRAHPPAGQNRRRRRVTASLLEQRYRHVLRLLPASYRSEREEEMAAEFMDMSGEVPDEVNPRPRWGEMPVAGRAGRARRRISSLHVENVAA